MELEITLRIILEDPPAGVDFGVQKGRGSVYETIQKQRSNSADLQFEFTITAAGSKTEKATFHGPIVQGPAGARFVYLDIGTLAGQSGSCWTRRLKIPIEGITGAMIEGLSTSPGAVLETRVSGTGRDGGPTCGTVKEFEGWTVA